MYEIASKVKEALLRIILKYGFQISAVADPSRGFLGTSKFIYCRPPAGGLVPLPAGNPRSAPVVNEHPIESVFLTNFTAMILYYQTKLSFEICKKHFVADESFEWHQ